MEQIIIAGRFGALNTSAVRYNKIASGSSWTSTEDYRRQIIPMDGIFSKLRIKLDGSPGTGKSYTFTLRVNGVDTVLAVTISDDETTGSELIQNVQVNAGDSVTFKCEPSGSPTARTAYWSILFSGGESQTSIIIGGYNNLPSATLITYNSLEAGFAWDTNEGNKIQIVTRSGTIKNLHILLDTAPGAGKSRTFTLRVNEADTTLTCTISDDETTGNDTSHEVTVSASDRVTLKCNPSGTPADCYAYWGATFKSDVDSENLILSGNNQDLIAAAVRWAPLSLAGDQSWNVESKAYQLGREGKIKNLYVRLSAKPDTGKSYTFTLRVNEADTALTVTISDDETTGSDTSNEVTISDDDYLTLQCTPSGTPDVVDAFWGVTYWRAKTVTQQEMQQLQGAI